MQQTDALDKNNKEIYEGDIVLFSDGLTGIENTKGYVDFQNGSFVIKTDAIIHYRWVDYTIEVVGSIYEKKT